MEEEVAHQGIVCLLQVHPGELPWLVHSRTGEVICLQHFHAKLFFSDGVSYVVYFDFEGVQMGDPIWTNDLLKFSLWEVDNGSATPWKPPIQSTNMAMTVAPFRFSKGWADVLGPNVDP
jgi:hypothetical protein